MFGFKKSTKSASLEQTSNVDLVRSRIIAYGDERTRLDKEIQSRTVRAMGLLRAEWHEARIAAITDLSCLSPDLLLIDLPKIMAQDLDARVREVACNTLIDHLISQASFVAGAATLNAARQLASIRQPAAVQRVLALMDSPDKLSRLFALLVAEYSRDPAYSNRLIQMAKENDFRVTVVRVLRQMNDERARAFLLKNDFVSRNPTFELTLNQALQLATRCARRDCNQRELRSELQTLQASISASRDPATIPLILQWVSSSIGSTYESDKLDAGAVASFIVGLGKEFIEPLKKYMGVFRKDISEGQALVLACAVIGFADTRLQPALRSILEDSGSGYSRNTCDEIRVALGESRTFR